MTLEESFTKRDLTTEYLIRLQDKIKNNTKVIMIEDLENRNIDEYIKYIKDEMIRLNTSICISAAWCFSKEIWEKEVRLYNELNTTGELNIILIPELFGSFILVKERELMSSVISSLGKEIIKYSDICIKRLEQTDNAIEITYYTFNGVYFFEEKPEELIKDESNKFKYE